MEMTRRERHSRRGGEKTLAGPEARQRPIDAMLEAIAVPPSLNALRRARGDRR